MLTKTFSGPSSFERASSEEDQFERMTTSLFQWIEAMKICSGEFKALGLYGESNGELERLELNVIKSTRLKMTKIKSEARIRRLRVDLRIERRNIKARLPDGLRFRIRTNRGNCAPARSTP